MGLYWNSQLNAPGYKIDMASRVPKPRTVGIIIAVSATFLILQIVGIKFLFKRLGSGKLLEERPPWEAVKLLLSKCETSGLQVFVIEPSLLRALREGSKRRIELWNQESHQSVAFGVINAGLDQMHLVVSAMKHEGYEHWEKVDADPRGISVFSKKSYHVITTHFLLWVPVQAHTPMLIHLVVFYKRENYLWHAPIHSDSHIPPFGFLHTCFGKNPGSYSLINLSTVNIDGVNVQYPNNTFSFLKEVEASEFIECNYTRAYHFYSKYRRDTSSQTDLFRRKARQLLMIVKTVLDSMGVPFWLSSGTCLGWFRQCDIIPHTTDVDIGIFITDYREEMVSLMENAGLNLASRFGKVSDSLDMSFLYGDIKLDIFFFYKTKHYMWNGGTQARTGNKYKYVFPHFHMCWTEFLELWVRVPCPANLYIHANYGAKWNIPMRAWDWKKSPNNVLENGRWSEAEMDEMVQLYDMEQ